MKIITHFLAIAFVFIISSCSSIVQISPTKKETNLAVKGLHFRGTIFTENYPIYNLPPNTIDATLKRFTPTIDDIQKVESLLRQRSKISSTDHDIRFIYNNLNKYYRQYIGFKSSNGDLIIHVNFVWDKDPVKHKHEDNYINTFDGGNHFWKANINMTIQKIMIIQINGIG